MTDQVLTVEGANELNKLLGDLQTESPKIGTKIVRSVLGAGATETSRHIRRKAPKGRIRRAVGSTVRKRRGQWIAKAGGNVGKRRGVAPDFHIHTLGTENRTTSRGENRGRIKPDDFVAVATKSAAPRVVDKMAERMDQRVEAEVSKAAK